MPSFKKLLPWLSCLSLLLCLSSSLQAQETPARDRVVLELRSGLLRGEVIIELYPEAAPRSVANFQSKARSGHYNGLAVHRILKGFMLQLGDPLSKNNRNKESWGKGGNNQSLPAEINLRNKRGSVGMARLRNNNNPRKNSNDSQFYIALKELSYLDGDYTVFGQVVSGMRFIDRLAAQRIDSRQIPQRRIEIVSSKSMRPVTKESASGRAQSRLTKKTKKPQATERSQRILNPSFASKNTKSSQTARPSLAPSRFAKNRSENNKLQNPPRQKLLRKKPTRTAPPKPSRALSSNKKRGKILNPAFAGGRVQALKNSPVKPRIAQQSQSSKRQQTARSSTLYRPVPPAPATPQQTTPKLSPRTLNPPLIASNSPSPRQQTPTRPASTTTSSTGTGNIQLIAAPPRNPVPIRQIPDDAPDYIKESFRQAPSPSATTKAQAPIAALKRPPLNPIPSQSTREALRNVPDPKAAETGRFSFGSD